MHQSYPDSLPFSSAQAFFAQFECAPLSSIIRRGVRHTWPEDGQHILALGPGGPLRLSGQAEYRLAVAPHSPQEELAPTSPLPSASTTSRPIFLTVHLGSVPPKTVICSASQGSPNITGPASCNSSSIGSREARDLPPLRRHPPLAASLLCPAHR